MAPRFTRQEILNRLKDTIKGRKPIIAAGCSIGIIAKCAELGGADLIMVYSTGLSRIRGMRTTLIPDSNNVTLRMFEEIGNVVKSTPIIAGIEATEPPATRDLAELVRMFTDIGFSGVINFPTFGLSLDEAGMRRNLEAMGLEPEKVEKKLQARIQAARDTEAEGLGFAREVEMVRLCRQMDIFTMTYVFVPEHAHQMAKAGADCIVAHAGATAGGIAGYKHYPVEEAAAKLQTMFEAASQANPEVILLGHGGPFAEPEDSRYLYQHTDAVGFVGASSIERIPVEKAVTGIVQEFKSIQI